MVQVAFLFVASWVLVGVASLQAPQVHIAQGALIGTTYKSAQGRQFSAFEGIPYAKPPVGKYRFKEPVEPKPWRGVWKATKPGSQCMQYLMVVPPEGDPVTGDEDCLFVNVYSPRVSNFGGTPLLDVIVYIHGGGFMHGASTLYGPKYLIDRDVVVVTMNYRLGFLGFMSTEDEVVPGNNGLKDQNMALRWIQKNIAAFGGNPDSVTLTGTSAGGASVHYHYLSPMSRGLFRHGMSFSGTTFLPWVLAEELRAKALKVGAAVGCSTHSSRDLVDCLRHRPARTILQETPTFMNFMYNPFSPFGPTIEVAGPEPFLPKHPVDIIMEGGMQDVPWMTTVTTEEGVYPVGEFIAKEDAVIKLDKNFVEIAASIFDYNYTVPRTEHKNVADRIRKFYLGDKPMDMAAMPEIIQMVGDRIFVVEGERAARLQAAISKSPVYFYQFEYRGKHSLSEALSGSTANHGCAHGDDTAFVIESFYSVTDETQEDRAMTQLLLDIWVSFAKTGTPTVPKSFGVTWEPIVPNAAELKFLHIANPKQLEMRTSVDLGNRHFWDSLPINEPQIVKTKPIYHSDEL